MTKLRSANSMDELPNLADILSRSGLSFMEDILNGTLAGPPIGEALNFWPIEVSEGRVVFEGAPQFAYTNPLGSLHGGWYGTVLDSCMACAVMTKLPKGTAYTTLEYKVNIIRPIPLGMTVHAIGTAQHVGRTTGIAKGEITGAEDGKIYATGSTTCIVKQIE